jgi:hypothetical protein
VNFLKQGTSLELFFKLPGPNCRIWDCVLIYKKSRDLFVNHTGVSNSGIIFELENPWTRSMSRGPWLVARSTADHAVA